MLNSYLLTLRLLVKLCALLLITITVLSPPSSPLALADEETLTLLPGQQHIYRFEYKGDRTEIIVVVDAPEGVELGVYEPDATEPVGRGARRDNEIVWAGKFRAPGVYRAIVTNTTGGPVLYSLAVLGESVSGVGRVIENEQPSSSSVSTQGGRKTLNVKLPTGARNLQSPIIPAQCTPAHALPPVINTSIKLCPNEIYPPMHLVGSNIGLFGDDPSPGSGQARSSAVINGGGRQFLVVMEGTGNWIDGVVIQAAPDAADAGGRLSRARGIG